MKTEIPTSRAGESLEAMLARMNRLAEEVRQRRIVFTEAHEKWAGEQAQSKTCETHQQIRKVNFPQSIDTSFANHQAGDSRMVLIYDPCPDCLAEAKTAKQSKWLTQCGVPTNLLHCSIENFICRTEQDTANLAVVEKFHRKRMGTLVMLGPPPKYGNGKSHLAVALIRLAGEGMFITNLALLDKIRDTYNDRKAEDIIWRCKRAKLLCLDEIGFSSGGRDELPAIHDILSHRHNEKKKTVITGNVATLEEFNGLIGPRMASRLQESGYRVLWFTGESRRPEMTQAYFEGTHEQ